jgi:SAM-dependent methyltransferase
METVEQKSQSWDASWERLFRARGWNKYPSEQVIRFVARNFFHAPDRSQIKILELGCAEGNNIWFMAREGFDAFGVEGSPIAVARAEERLQGEGLSATLVNGDVANLTTLFPNVRFDAIMDAGCLTCNRVGVVDNVLNQIGDLLKPGGKVFSLVIADGTYGSETGKEVEPGTFTDIQDGALQGIGLCHVFTLDEVQNLFSRFSDVHIEYIMSTQDDQQQLYKHWVIDATAAK